MSTYKDAPLATELQNKIGIVKNTIYRLERTENDLSIFGITNQVDAVIDTASSGARQTAYKATRTTFRDYRITILNAAKQAMASLQSELDDLIL